MHIKLSPQCLFAYLSLLSIHLFVSIQTIYIVAVLCHLSVSLSSCLFTQCVCTFAFLRSMHTSILKRPALLSVFLHSNVETLELGRDQDPWPRASWSHCQLGWQHVPAVGTLWHRWAREKYSGGKEMTVRSYSWGVGDKDGPPSQHTTTQYENKSPIIRNLLIWSTKLPILLQNIAQQ